MGTEDAILEELRYIRKLLEENSEYNRQVKQQQEEDKTDLEIYRDSLYQEHKDSILYQILNKKVDWKHLRIFFDFRTPAQTKIYVEKRLKEEGLLE
jgi:hypothetical protein